MNLEARGGMVWSSHFQDCGYLNEGESYTGQDYRRLEWPGSQS